MTHRSNNNNIPNGEITPVAVVTGSSSGIGFEIALMLARNGFQTYATMRNLAKSENIKSIASKENLPFIYNNLMLQMINHSQMQYKQ
jgi:NADP-dependent 3-hydroxy acid dehydrogenase YdfG